MPATLERPTDARQEWSHSCTPQCPPDCEAAKNVLAPAPAAPGRSAEPHMEKCAAPNNCQHPDCGCYPQR